VAQLQSHAPTSRTGKRKTALKDSHVLNLENRIRERVGTRVNLRYAKGKGAVELAFFSDDELERILQLLGVKAE